MEEAPVTLTSLEPGSDQGFQRLRRELGVTSFGMNLITLQPRQRLRVHRHEQQEEVYLVIEGELTLIVEGQEHTLGPGRIARVDPEARRQLTNPGSERAAVLALGGHGEHHGRDGVAWTEWDEEGPGRPPQEVPAPPDLPPD